VSVQCLYCTLERILRITDIPSGAHPQDPDSGFAASFLFPSNGPASSSRMLHAANAMPGPVVDVAMSKFRASAVSTGLAYRFVRSRWAVAASVVTMPGARSTPSVAETLCEAER
jgi:hypothetical protein